MFLRGFSLVASSLFFACDARNGAVCRYLATARISDIQMRMREEAGPALLGTEGELHLQVNPRMLPRRHFHAADRIPGFLLPFAHKQVPRTLRPYCISGERAVSVMP